MRAKLEEKVGLDKEFIDVMLKKLDTKPFMQVKKMNDGNRWRRVVVHVDGVGVYLLASNLA